MLVHEPKSMAAAPAAIRGRAPTDASAAHASRVTGAPRASPHLARTFQTNWAKVRRNAAIANRAGSCRTLYDSRISSEARPHADVGPAGRKEGT